MLKSARFITQACGWSHICAGVMPQWRCRVMGAPPGRRACMGRPPHPLPEMCLCTANIELLLCRQYVSRAAWLQLLLYRQCPLLNEVDVWGTNLKNISGLSQAVEGSRIHPKEVWQPLMPQRLSTVIEGSAELLTRPHLSCRAL